MQLYLLVIQLKRYQFIDPILARSKPAEVTLGCDQSHRIKESILTD